MVSIDVANELLKQYDKFDHDRLEKVRKILNNKENWDKTIKNNNEEDIEITLLLAYEYATAAEKITYGRIKFEDMLEKLDKGIDKFRLGELKKGDEDILYGKTFDDKRAYQVKSLEYDRKVRKNTGASHFMYFDKDEEFKTAVAIFAKKNLPQNENGEIVTTTGCDFSNLSDIRQTVFHEWNHQMEQVFIDQNNHYLPYEYIGVDGKKYRNYDKVKHCRIFNKEELSELISLPEKKQFMISTGISTKEIVEPSEEHPDGIVMHNQITEGFVELISREMMKSIEVSENEIDHSKYYEPVEIIKRIVRSRDRDEDKGKTYADFLTNSTILKKELESIEIEGKDGLHYIAEYADKAFENKTEKKVLLSKMPDVVEKLNLSKEQVEKLKSSYVFTKDELNSEDIDFLRKELLQGNEQNQELNIFVTDFITEYSLCLSKEKAFFDEIPTKLGYRQKEEKNSEILDDAVKVTEESTRRKMIINMENNIEKQINEPNLGVKKI